jgi:2-methylcitrate dehydratase PrpD
MTSAVTRDIAEYVVGMELSDIPELAIARAKTAILDTIGVTLAGSRLQTGRMMMEYVEQTGATEVATVFASGRKSSPELAALANGLLAHVLDYDDRGHVSTHTLPPALALGERDNVSGEELLVAYVVGREVRQHIDEEFRPGRKSLDGSTEQGSGPGWRGWHETGVVGAIGATAAAARVTRLDVDKAVMAIGIAASLASGLMANFGTSTKSLHAGNAARNGVLAVSLAAKGFTADPNILTARRGYAEALSYPETRDMSRVVEGLRSYFHLVDKGIRIKPYPACTGTHQFIETMRFLCREHGLHPADVETITISRISGQTTKRDFPTTELECKFSPAFVAIAALVDGQLTLDNCTREFLSRPDVQDLLNHTTYEDSASGFIRVQTKDGQTVESASRPVRDLIVPDESLAKFFECAEPVVGKERASQIHEIVADLERLGSIRELTALLSPGH